MTNIELHCDVSVANSSGIAGVLLPLREKNIFKLTQSTSEWCFLCLVGNCNKFVFLFHSTFYVDLFAVVLSKLQLWSIAFFRVSFFAAIVWLIRWFYPLFPWTSFRLTVVLVHCFIFFNASEIYVCPDRMLSYNIQNQISRQFARSTRSQYSAISKSKKEMSKDK